jgi:hypothetical protein
VEDGARRRQHGERGETRREKEKGENMRLVCGPHDPICHIMSKSTKLRVKTNTSAPVPHYEKSTFGEIREVTCPVLLIERVSILGFAFLGRIPMLK